MIYTEEKLSDEFTKHHIGFKNLPVVIHQFTDIDKGPPHDHPATFRTHILKGSYLEFIYKKTKHGWKNVYKLRKTGDSFIIRANHIHQIVALPQGECWTVSIGPKPTQTWGFYEFRADGAYKRAHDQETWTKL